MLILRKIIGIFLVLLLFFGSFAFLSYYLYNKDGKSLAQQNIIIPHETTRKITELLQKKNILDANLGTTLFFRIVVHITKKQGELHSAELSFPAHASIRETLYILRHGQPVSHSLTIAEGLTAEEIKELLNKAEMLKGDIKPFKEGSIFPQTYFYHWGMERSSIIERSQNLMTMTLNNIWENRDAIALNNIIKTPEELLILASLIEKESRISSERPLIARVFLNRLKRKMKLQTDPTVIYALTNGRGHLMRHLSHDDLKTPSPYNTYYVEGLPPTPICSPSKDSLYAAAHPAKGNMLYFVASGKGGHQFAETLSEQDAHIRSYRKFEKMNGK